MIDSKRLHVPSFVPVLNPLLRRLIRAGIPVGPNALISVRGRKTGIMRTTAVAVVESQGRRWIIGTFGEVNWVRNLRASGEAVLSSRGRRETLHASELSPTEAADFFTGVLVPYVGNSAIKRAVLGALGAGDILANPAAAASARPVFELA